MKLVTYHGPSDQLRAKGRLIPAGSPTEVPNDVAKQAVRRCGSRVTVEDLEVAPPEGASPHGEGDTNAT